MNRAVRVLVLLGAGGLVAVGIALTKSDSRGPGLVLVGTAIAIGELVELRPPMRAALPLSFAYTVVLARRTTPAQAILVLVTAMAAAAIVRAESEGMGGRLVLLGQRLVAGVSCILTYRVVSDAVGEPPSRAGVLLTLVVAAIVPILVADLLDMAWSRRLSLVPHGRSADVALAASAVLMAIADQGIGRVGQGSGGMGLWGPAVFTIPLLAAWYAYERLAEIRRTYEQTIRALGAAPELGGMVRSGHAERVASLSVAIGRELGLSRAEMEHLETAALLHHLGQVCVDEPEDGRPPEAGAVAEAGAAILRSTPLLAPAGDVVAAETMPSLGAPTLDEHVVLSGQILKVVSAFDELAEGDAARAATALETLYSGPGYLYESKVLGALEIVLDRRELLDRAD